MIDTQALEAQINRLNNIPEGTITKLSSLLNLISAQQLGLAGLSESDAFSDSASVATTSMPNMQASTPAQLFQAGLLSFIIFVDFAYFTKSDERIDLVTQMISALTMVVDEASDKNINAVLEAAEKIDQNIEESNQHDETSYITYAAELGCFAGVATLFGSSFLCLTMPIASIFTTLCGCGLTALSALGLCCGDDNAEKSHLPPKGMAKHVSESSPLLTKEPKEQIKPEPLVEAFSKENIEQVFSRK